MFNIVLADKSVTFNVMLVTWAHLFNSLYKCFVLVGAWHSISWLFIKAHLLISIAMSIFHGHVHLTFRLLVGISEYITRGMHLTSWLDSCDLSQEILKKFGFNLLCTSCDCIIWASKIFCLQRTLWKHLTGKKGNFAVFIH